MNNISANQYADVVSEWQMLATFMDNPLFVYKVKAELFTGERVLVYEAMVKAYTQDGKIQQTSVRALLQGKFPRELNTASTGDFQALQKELARLAHKRQLRDISERLLLESEKFTPNLSAARESAHIDPVLAVEDSSITLAASEYLGSLRAKKIGEYPFIRTGINRLDNKMSGEWQRQGLTIVLGQPGSGKTTLVTNTMLRGAMPRLRKLHGNAIEDRVIPSLFISLEMPKRLLYPKFIADLRDLNYTNLLTGRLNDDDFRIVEQTTTLLQKLNMYIIDNQYISLYDILYQIREHHRLYKIEVAYIDYLQIVNFSTGDRINDLGFIAKSLKDLAKELDIAVVLLSQVTPGNEDIERIRESRVPGQIADVVFELLQEDSAAGDYIKDVVISFYKNRFGPLGQNNLLFNGESQRFYDGTEHALSEEEKSAYFNE